MNKAKEELKKIMNRKITQKQAYDFFDKLESLELSDIMGVWKGRELYTGHPMEGLLDICKWYGKEFKSTEKVYPLIFKTSKDKLFYCNPGLLPFNTSIQKIPKRLIPMIFNIIRPLIITNKSKARLRMTKYRGVISASMLYDRLPIIDIFRKIDDNTIMGLMDSKLDKSRKGYFFILYKDVL